MDGKRTDRWSRWVLEDRHGSDAEVAAKDAAHLARSRDRVLEHAHVGPGDVVLDVGTGDGLIGRGAARLVGPSGRVIYSDVSAALLAHVATEVDHEAKATFVLAGVEDLSEVESGSVDVVTLRAVLIYVREKRRAFEELRRVLAPGGRLSLLEPINTRMCDPDRYWHYDVRPIRDLVDRLQPVTASDEPDPMTDFDETTLLTLAEAVGFTAVHLRLEVDVEPSVEPMGWSTFLQTSLNPNAPTLADAMSGSLDASERARLERHLRPLVEGGVGVSRVAFAYLWGRA